MISHMQNCVPQNITCSMLSRRRWACIIPFLMIAPLIVWITAPYQPSVVQRQAWETATPCPQFSLNDLSYCGPSVNDTNHFDRGAPFGLAPDLLRRLSIPLKDFVSKSTLNTKDFVFATASDENYFIVSLDAIGNVQRFFPNYTIYYYDLSRSPNPGRSAKIQRLCNVVYRRFDYTLYPEFVKQLKTYAFKPLIVHEMLREFPGVFWIDSSVRFQTSNITSALEQAHSNDGILAFARSHHSNFAVIHPGMFRYLPISASAAGNTEQRDANSILFYRTEEVYTRIVVWWVLCALKEDCMAAGRQLYCGFKGKYQWAGCHRFDQAAINILMARHFDYDDQKYLSRETVLLVQRGSSRKETLKVCNSSQIIMKDASYFG